MALSIVVTTLGSEAEASELAKKVVEERLAACVQIVACQSHYIFEGQLEASPEWRLEMKTTDERRDALMARVGELHSYDLPEIVVLPLATASADYTNWVCNAVGPLAEQGS